LVLWILSDAGRDRAPVERGTEGRTRLMPDSHNAVRES
jgi:hypothetical protein